MRKVRYREVAAWMLVILIGFAFFKKEVIIVKDRLQTAHVKYPDVSGKKLGDVIKVRGPEIDKLIQSGFVFHRPFSKEDIKMAKLAVRFAEELTGERYEANYENLYWSDDMLKKVPGLLGMTVFHDGLRPWQAYIVLTSEIKPKDLHNLNVMRDFASVLIHEWSHAKCFSHEVITRYKINMILEMSFDFFHSMPVESFFDGKERAEYKDKPYHLMLEKAAYDAGIPQPYIFVRDWSGSEIGGTLRLLTDPAASRIIINIETNINTRTNR